MSTQKELNFFVAERNWHKGIAWYEKQFHGSTPVIGEASPNYTFYPQWSGVPERMHAVLPTAKLIYILRHPIKRMIPQYVHAYADGYEHRSINDALLHNFDTNAYILRSRYHMQLQQYLPYYPLSQILVLTQENLLQERRQTLQKVFQFLGVDASFYCPQYATLKHQTSDKRRKNRTGVYLKKMSESRLIKWVPSDTRQKIGNVLYRPFSKKIKTLHLDPSIKERIADLLQDDVDQLRKLTGMRFEHWDI